MEFDVLLPMLVFFVVVVSVFLHQKFEKKIGVLFEKKKLSTREVVLMVLYMAVMVTVMAFFPRWAIQIWFISSYSFMMFLFTYVALKKWYVAIFPPIVFILSYFLYWNLYIFNLFAGIFAVIITVYLGTLFSWKTTWVFALLLTVMDVIHVFITGFMGEFATKMLELKLPVAVMVLTYPAGTLVSLGLGDIFLAGLLTIQTEIKNGWKTGILTALTISVAMFIFEIALFNTMFVNFFPATVVVITGWIVGIGIARFTL